MDAHTIPHNVRSNGVGDAGVAALVPALASMPALRTVALQ